MKICSKILALLLLFFVLASTAAQAQTKPKGWSRKAKGAVAGGVGGAVVGGGAIGRAQDKKKDPARYYHYKNN